eukprot:scaffold283710_cov24-Prasinocladus_malaysianus.AAC.1
MAVRTLSRANPGRSWSCGRGKRAIPLCSALGAGHANKVQEARKAVKMAAAAAAEATSAGEMETTSVGPPPPKPSREVKWQEEPLVLNPAGHTRVVGKGEGPRMFGREEWTSRVER